MKKKLLMVSILRGETGMYKMGRMAACGMVCAVLFLLAACADGNADISTENQAGSVKTAESTETTKTVEENECFEEFSPIEHIAVGILEEGGTVSSGYEEIEGISILYEASTEQEIERILAMFDGWNMEENKVGEDDILDLSGGVYIGFNDIWYFQVTSEQEEDGRYYGFIRGIAYDFPQEFGDFLVELLQDAESSTTAD